ncbi:MAG: hypothetical protein AAFY15_10320 [Cyanobacteria bacterium J06648_11]
MARYSCVYHLSGSAKRVREILVGVFDSDRFVQIHDSPAYWVMREQPGRVPFDQLVTIEFLLDVPPEGDRFQLTCIAKNDALTLQRDNHCRHVFDGVESIVKQIATSPT